MKSTTRVFVSYTERDGHVTIAFLQRLHDSLVGICDPFIHAISAKRRSLQQRHVIRELLRSDLLIVIESPAVYRSPWVRFELLVSKIKLMPIIRLDADEIGAPLSNKASEHGDV